MPHRFEVHVVVLAFIQSIYTVHMNVLLGRQRIRAFNLLGGARALVLLLVFAVLVFRPTGDPMDYVWASYAAFGTTSSGQPSPCGVVVRPRPSFRGVRPARAAAAGAS